MAPNLEAEAPHNNFDVRTISILQKAEMASLETHLSPLRNVLSITPQWGVQAQSIHKRQKNGLADT